MLTTLYFMYHSYKHILRVELALRMICDWAMIIKKANATGFEGDYFWDPCRDYGHQRLAVASVGLGSSVCGTSAPKSIKRDSEAETVLQKYIMTPVSVS